MDSLSNLWMFTNSVLQNLQQLVRPRHMICRLSRFRFGIVFLLHQWHLCSDSSSVVDETHIGGDRLRRLALIQGPLYLVKGFGAVLK